ncbi:MAG: restriction endonuclease subunit S [Treponema sp.]|nr:restriction endonuclease subunit S [Treponema sp.]
MGTNNKIQKKGITLVIPNPCGNIKETKMKNSGVEWIGEIPEDWEVKPVKRYFSHVKRIVGDDVDKYERLSLTMQGVLKRSKDDAEGLQPEKFNGYQILKQNELVFKLIDLENVNTSRVGISPFNGLVSPAYIILTNNKKDNTFYYYWFLNMYYQEIFNKLGAGGVRSALNASDVLSLPMVYLNNETQQRIATYLDKKCSKIEETIQNQQQVIEKLKAYKQSLITETVTGKIKIQNGKVCGEYESYKDSGVEYLGKIPSNWKAKRLRYIGKCQNGISKGGEFFGSGYPFVSYGDVYNNLVLPETVSGLIESTHEEQENYSVKAGDIFFTRTSETIEEVGFTSVCLKTIEKATFAGFVIRVRPFTEELVPDYSKYYFSSDAHRRFFVKEMNLVTRASLSQDLLKRLPVLIPSKDEQKEIANYLDKKCTAIDTAIEQKQNLIEKLTEYKKSLIYECVTGKKAI